MGQVINQNLKQPLAGATILETGTTNGTATNSTGRFTLSVVAASDSVLVTVAAIGFVPRRLRLAAGRYADIALDSSRLRYDSRPRLGYIVGLFPGLRYAPFGGSLALSDLRFVTPSLAYQTNLRRNHTWHARLESYEWSRNGRFMIQILAEYQRLQLAPAALHFTSYTATLGLRKHRIGRWRGPAFLLTTGYAQRRAVAADGSTSAGFGYGVGLRHEFLNYPFRLAVETHATRWPGYWQLHGQMLHSFAAYRCQAGVAMHWLPRYREISLLFHYRLPDSPPRYFD